MFLVINQPTELLINFKEIAKTIVTQRTLFFKNVKLKVFHL